MEKNSGAEDVTRSLDPSLHTIFDELCDRRTVGGDVVPLKAIWISHIGFPFADPLRAVTVPQLKK